MRDSGRLGTSIEGVESVEIVIQIRLIFVSNNERRNIYPTFGVCLRHQFSWEIPIEMRLNYRSYYRFRNTITSQFNRSFMFKLL